MQPRIVVVMGEPALETLNEVGVPLASTLEPRLGRIQQLTPTIDALYVPDIDESLDSEESKREFWTAFRVARRLVLGPAAVLDQLAPERLPRPRRREIII